ncbi:hypothetical protein [Cellulomonas fimi]|uniref:hypothetical protein n=1 Tax=Cellulomonas fimi TaxID=1708 RepID=UPI0023589D5C|nr:hypothetical protein [Cellulomonas fimi]
MLPIVQLAGAAATFACWAVVSIVADNRTESAAATALAVASVVAVVVSLGIPPMLPTEARERATGSGTSVTATICAAVSCGMCLSGLVVAAFPGRAVLALTLGQAGLLSLSTLVQVVARLRNAPRQMVVAALPPLVLPAGTALTSALGGGLRLGALGTCAAGVAVAIVVARPYLRHSRSPRPHALKRQLGRSLLLVPHLVAFAIIVQGLRLSGAVIANGAVPVPLHHLALAAGVATTVLASVHGLLTVDVQLAGEDDLTSAVTRAGRRYAALGAGCGALVLLGVALLPIALPEARHPDLDVQLMLAAVFPAMTAYYATSAGLLRRGSTAQISATSIIVAAVLLSSSVALHGDVVRLAVGLFLVAALALAPVACLLGLWTRALEPAVTARLAAPSYAVALAAAVVAVTA